MRLAIPARIAGEPNDFHIRYGSDAAIIGTVADGPVGKVYVRTAFGATRIMDMLVGEQLPRIC